MLKVNENVLKINEAMQAEQVEEDEGPEVATGEATSAVVDLQRNDESDPSFNDLVRSLNVDQS